MDFFGTLGCMLSVSSSPRRCQLWVHSLREGARSDLPSSLVLQTSGMRFGILEKSFERVAASCLSSPNTTKHEGGLVAQ